MSVHTILLVPADGDPHGLLASDDCGGRPPVVAHCPWCERWVQLADHCECGCDLCNVSPTTALAIAWAGKPLEMGMDRLCRVTCRLLNRDIRYLDMPWDAEATTLEAVAAISTVAQNAGTVVLLDEHDQVIDHA